MQQLQLQLLHPLITCHLCSHSTIVDVCTGADQIRNKPSGSSDTNSSTPDICCERSASTDTTA
jgi:hypothetical protein